MNFRTIFKLVGVLIVLIGVSMSFSLFWSLYLDEPDAAALAESIAICLASGGILYGVGWRSQAPILRREGMAVVGVGWLLVALFGALPFYLSGASPKFVDAYFEAMSGFTTTGSTILTNIEACPKGVLFWRSFIHWLGGMGIVVLFVAILPYLRAGGRQLFRSEVPGPTAEVLRPRVSETASTLWKIYVSISAVEVLLLFLQGQSFYDALCHTFGTMATGGFSTKNASVGQYESATVDLTIIVFMVLAGTNFGLYFHLFRGDWRVLFRDEEWRFYIGVVVGSIVLIVGDLLMHGIYESVGQAVRYASFQVVAIVTTTGFGTADFNEWPAFSQLILLILMFVGGCAGSTGGGVKVIRMLVLVKSAWLGVERVFRPHVIRALRIGGQPVEEPLQDAIHVYMVLIVSIFLICSLFMAALGLDLLTATTSVIATLNNIGPGLAGVGPAANFAFIPDAGKWLLSLCMVLGRLELFSILVLFVPAFWRGH
jgi:trk system potassium uptake protein TrkH